MGKNEYLQNLTFNDLRNELRGKMTKAYVFYDDQKSTLCHDETILLPKRIIKDDCHLAILMPYQPNTKDLDNSIQNALKEDKITAKIYGTHVPPYDEIFGFAAFNGNPHSLEELLKLIALHLLEELDATISNYIIFAVSMILKTWSELSTPFTQLGDLKCLNSLTYKKGEKHDLDVIQVFAKITSIDNMSSWMTHSPSALVVSGCNVDIMMLVIGDEWTYLDAKYKS